METPLNNCQTHKKPILVYCLEKCCNNPKLCGECIRSHENHYKKFYSFEELSKLVNDFLTKNLKIKDLRSSTKTKDIFLSEKTPEIIKCLKDALEKFVVQVEKTIFETGNTRFGLISLFLPDDTRNTNSDELLKTYKGLETAIEDEKIENIESDLKIWEERCFKTIKSISEQLDKTIPEFGLIKNALKNIKHGGNNVKNNLPHQKQLEEEKHKEKKEEKLEEKPEESLEEKHEEKHGEKLADDDDNLDFLADDPKKKKKKKKNK